MSKYLLIYKHKIYKSYTKLSNVFLINRTKYEEGKKVFNYGLGEALCILLMKGGSG
jgi:hypothetical protein